MKGHQITLREARRTTGKIIAGSRCSNLPEGAATPNHRARRRWSYRALHRALVPRARAPAPPTGHPARAGKFKSAAAKTAAGSPHLQCTRSRAFACPTRYAAAARSAQGLCPSPWPGSPPRTGRCAPQTNR